MSTLSELNNEDAKDILKHLISMFKKYDLSDVHEIVSSKLKQDENVHENVSSKLKQDEIMALENKQIDMRKYLKRYIHTSIEILHSRSSEHYDKVLGKLNKYIQCENDQNIRGVKLHLSPVEMELTGHEEIDLIKLPDYSILIHGLKEILGESNWRGRYD